MVCELAMLLGGGVHTYALLPPTYTTDSNGFDTHLLKLACIPVAFGGPWDISMFSIICWYHLDYGAAKFVPRVTQS